MKKYQLLLLSTLTGVLLSLAWPANGFPLLLFFALIPLLFIEDYICKNKLQFSRFSVLGYAYVAFLVWNSLTTWWICNSTLFGAAMAIIFNSLFMAVTFLLFHLTKRNTNNLQGYTALICYWLTFEYLHLDWDLSWSWLNLGNGFAAYPDWVQWYEYTGTFGGTLWILLVNILLYNLLNYFITNKTLKVRFVKLIPSLLLILLPVNISLYIYYKYEEIKNPVNITVVQPNIDPYNEKFDGMSAQEQLDKIINLAKSNTDSLTDLVVCPETAIPNGLWINNLSDYSSIQTLREFIKEYPALKIVIGLSAYKMYTRGEEISSTARKYTHGEGQYDAYNSAMFLDSTQNIQLYHKSKLVPGVEKMPFPRLMKPLEKFAFDMGGTTGSLGIQKERTVFITNRPDSLKIAPVICYESIYGGFMTEYIRKGANLICIITNDGWWKNTPGHRQHLQYARLRAIETRRSIARSANTGTSCFINQRGDVFQATEWWVPAAIRQDVNINSRITLYVKWGDYLGRIAVFASGLLIIITAVTIILSKKRLGMQR